MARRFTFQAPAPLARQIQAFARARGMRQGEAIRTLLRAGLGAPDDERGYREGVSRGHRQFREALARALHELEKAFPPR